MNNKKNIIFIVLIGIIVYINSLKNNFVWDDIFTVIDNDFIKGYRLIKEIFLKPLFYFANTDYLYYRPLQSLSNMFDYYIWGLNPLGFHLTNVLLHICAAILIYYFVNILFDDRELSFFTSLLFVVHPINTSVVNYITSRADTLLTIFTISSLIFFLEAKHYKFYLLSLICFILALLSKETAMIFPLCLIFTREMYAKIKKERIGFEIVTARFWYIAFMAIPIAYILLRIKIIGVGANIFPPSQTNLLGIVVTLSKISINYLKLIYLPFALHMLRNIAIVELTKNIIILYIIFISLDMLFLLVIYRLNKIIFFSLGLFLLWVLPIGLIALKNPEYYFQHKAIMEEHWLYIPSIGIFILTVYIIRKLSKYIGKAFYKTALLLFVIYLSVVTLKENTYWKNNYTLFTHTSKYVNNSITIYRNLGWIYLNKQDINKSIEMYRRALDIKQDDKHKVVLYKDLAYAYFLNNQIDEAANACQEALDINYNYAGAHGCLGLIHSKNDLQKDIARREWKVALEIYPFNAIAFNNLLMLSKTDNNIRSYLIEKYNRLLNQYNCFEQYRVYRALGIIYLYNGIHSSAISCIKKARQINPYDVKINNVLAVYYAESEDFNKAIKYFKIALKLNPFDKETYKNFAALYTQLNRIEEARMLIEKSESINMFN